MATKKRKAVKKDPKKAKIAAEKIKARKKKPSKLIGKVGGLVGAQKEIDRRLTVTVKAETARERKIIKDAAKREKKLLSKLAKQQRIINAQARKLVEHIERSERAKRGWQKRLATSVIRERLAIASMDGRFYAEVKDLFVIYDEFYTLGEIYTLGMSP